MSAYHIVCRWDRKLRASVPSGLCSTAFCRFSITCSSRIISSISRWASTLKGSAASKSCRRSLSVSILACRRSISSNVSRKRTGSWTAFARSGALVRNWASSAGFPKTRRRYVSGSGARLCAGLCDPTLKGCVWFALICKPSMESSVIWHCCRVFDPSASSWSL